MRPLIAMFILLFPALALAGAWVHEPGSAWVETSYRYTVADKMYDRQGTRLPRVDAAFTGPTLSRVFDHARYVGHEASLYAEIGFLPHLEVVGRLPWRTIQSEWSWRKGTEAPLIQANQGFGDAMLGLRGGTLLDQVAIAAHGTVSGPLYDNRWYALGRGPGDGDFVNDRPPLGQGTVDTELGLAVGSSVGPVWFQGEVGTRFRDRGYATILPGRLQVGIRPIPEIAGFSEASGQTTVGESSQPSFFIDRWDKSPLVNDRQHWVVGSAGLLVQPLARAVDAPLNGLGLAVRYDATLHGVRTAALRSLGGSLIWSL